MASPQELLLQRLGETAAQQKWAEHDHLHAAAASRCPISNGISLPELREAIFARVSGADLLRLMRVCKDLHAAVKQSRVLQHLLFAVKEPDLDVVKQYISDVSTTSVASSWALNQLFVAPLESSDGTIKAVLRDIPGETGDIEKACVSLQEGKEPELKINFHPGYFSALSSRPPLPNESWTDLFLLYPLQPIRLTIEYTARYRIPVAIRGLEDGKLPDMLRQIYNRASLSVTVAPLPLSQLFKVARGIRWAMNESELEDYHFRDDWVTENDIEIGNRDTNYSWLRLPQEIDEYVSPDAHHVLRRIGCRSCGLKHGEDFDCTVLMLREMEAHHFINMPRAGHEIRRVLQQRGL